MSSTKNLERNFFRMLNAVLEPAIRRGVASPRFAPGGLIVLETIGRQSGRKYRTPLVATRMGGYVFICTARGERSQWVRNLNATPHTRYWLGGRERHTRAFVMYPGKRFRLPTGLPGVIQSAVKFLAPYTRAGWAFAVLRPR